MAGSVPSNNDLSQNVVVECFNSLQEVNHNLAQSPGGFKSCVSGLFLIPQVIVAFTPLNYSLHHLSLNILLLASSGNYLHSLRNQVSSVVRPHCLEFLAGSLLVLLCNVRITYHR